MPLAARSPRLPGACVVTLAATLAGCGGSSGFLGLSDGPSDVDRVFLLGAGNWDRNKDGLVTCDEWKAYANELFDDGDVERKGYLVPADWQRITAIDKMFVTVDFKYYDHDGDGKVERAEFVDRPNRAFELADRDHDCNLTSVELTGARTAAKPAEKIVPAGSESGTDKGHPGGSAGGAGRVP